MENKESKKIFVIAGIIVLILAVVIGTIVMNSNNNEKYLEIAKRTLPEMKNFLLETVESSVELKQSALSVMKTNKYYSKEQAIDTVKQSNSYKYYEMKIDEEMSKMYKDLEYLKKHSYSKNRELSNQIKGVIEKFEKSVQEHKELNIDSSYSNEPKTIYETIQELQNTVNRE